MRRQHTVNSMTTVATQLTLCKNKSTITVTKNCNFNQHWHLHNNLNSIQDVRSILCLSTFCVFIIIVHMSPYPQEWTYELIKETKAGDKYE